VRGPSSPRGWLCWAAYVLEAQGRPFSARLDGIPGGDFRIRDSKEAAISVKRLLERCTNGDGGAELLFAHYVREAGFIEEQMLTEGTTP
jgi:hypothetical protein